MDIVIIFSNMLIIFSVQMGKRYIGSSQNALKEAYTSGYKGTAHTYILTTLPSLYRLRHFFTVF
jgi:hypothetical protein